MVDVIRDPFHRALAELLKEEIDEKIDRLARGEAARITEDTTSVGEKYAARVSWIAALRSVLDLCHQIETNQETMGPRPAQVKVSER